MKSDSSDEAHEIVWGNRILQIIRHQTGMFLGLNGMTMVLMLKPVSYKVILTM